MVNARYLSSNLRFHVSPCRPSLYVAALFLQPVDTARIEIAANDGNLSNYDGSLGKRQRGGSKCQAFFSRELTNRRVNHPDGLSVQTTMTKISISRLSQRSFKILELHKNPSFRSGLAFNLSRYDLIEQFLEICWS